MVEVLYTCGFADVAGGGQVSMLLIIEHLDKTRYHPVVLCPAPGEVSRRAEALGAEAVFLAQPKLRTLKFWKPLAFIFRLRRLVKSRGFGIIHCDTPNLAFCCGLASLATDSKLVFHARVSDAHGFDRLLHSLSSAVICVSNAAAKRFPQEKIRVVYNGVDTARCKPAPKAEARRKLGLAPEGFVAGYAGQLIKGKGIGVLIEAFASVRPEIPGAKLVICGRGPEEDFFKAKASSPGLGNSVLFAGFFEDIAPVYPAFDALVLAGEHHEGLSRVLIEAMACGVPVIATDIGGNPETVLDGETGFLVPVGSVSLIAEKLLWLAKNSPEKMRENARKMAVEFFDIKLNAAGVAAVYGSALRLKNGFLKTVYFSLRRILLSALGIFSGETRFEKNRVKKILLIRIDRIGDAVLSTPFFSNLAEFFPEAEITLLCRPAAAKLLSADGNVKRMILWEGPGIISRLRREKFDLAVDMHQDTGVFTALLARASGAGYRLGFDVAGRGVFFNLRVPAPFAKSFGSELEDLAARIGCPSPRKTPALRADQRALGNIMRRLSENGFLDGDKILLIHPGGYYKSQRWPAGRFAEAALSAAESGFKIAVVSGQDERAELETLRKILGEKAVYFQAPPVEELAALIGLSSVFAGNNSGPLHIACAFGVPSVSTLGPTDPARWAPSGEKNIVLTAEDCDVDNITVEQMREAILRLGPLAVSLGERRRLITEAG